MSDKPAIPLNPIPVNLDHPFIKDQIINWLFSASDSYVLRLLKHDIYRRVMIRKTGKLWVYLDPEQYVVGFGSLDVCRDHRVVTGNKLHTLIPLLAVNPAKQRRGHGTAIVKHLISEAERVVFQSKGSCHDTLFLEVYADNKDGIELYSRRGFSYLSDSPAFDKKENRHYFVMIRKLSC